MSLAGGWRGAPRLCWAAGWSGAAHRAGSGETTPGKAGKGAAASGCCHRLVPAPHCGSRPGPCPAPSRAHSPPRAQRGTRREKQLWFRLSIFFCCSIFNALLPLPLLFLCWCRCSFPQDFWGRAIPDAAFRIQTGLVGCSSFEGFALSQGVLRRDRNRLFKAVCFELSWHIQARLFLCFLKKLYLKCRDNFCRCALIGFAAVNVL